MLKHCRNFGVYADEIVELGSLLQVATELGVEVHVNWDTLSPALWELEFIRNVGSVRGCGSTVLRLLTVAADVNRKTIIGFAQNMIDSREPPAHKLMTWYARHGFEAGSTEAHGVQIKRNSGGPTSRSPCAINRRVLADSSSL